MNVLNVTSSLDLMSGGGTAERTFQMSRFLGRSGVRCTVLTLNIGLDATRIEDIAPATVVQLDYLWKRFYVPRVNLGEIYKLVNDADIVHLIGHWGILNAVVYLIARWVGKPYVVCPAGALPLFGRSAWLKRVYNLLVGRSLIKNAAGWIAVTPAELPHFKSYGISEAQVMVIPNGVSKEDFPITDKASFLRRHQLPNAPLILFMGRLNPIKGPDLLLEAFAAVSETLPQHQLVFVGPDGGLLAQLQEYVQLRGLVQRVHFLGHLEGEEKSSAYRVAQLLVVPSRQEAMSIVALEAGICGTPVLLTDHCGFKEVKEVDERLEVSSTAAGLAEGLIRLLTNTTQLTEIAPRWRHFVENRYTWETLVFVYLRFYKNVLRTG